MVVGYNYRTSSSSTVEHSKVYWVYSILLQTVLSIRQCYTVNVSNFFISKKMSSLLSATDSYGELEQLFYSFNVNIRTSYIFLLF